MWVGGLVFGGGELGFGDWGLCPIPIPNPQSPIPNPQSPIPIFKKGYFQFINYKLVIKR